MKRFLPVLLCLLPALLRAQYLTPGFDKDEYIELLRVSARQWDTLTKDIPLPDHFVRDYRSEAIGLDNQWELWSHKSAPVAVISIRGTTTNSVSWLENFYAAMVPAAGELHLGRRDKFAYRLADNPRAAVHVGWLTGMAFLAEDILPKMDDKIKRGIQEFIIVGHSQGGAIAYLLTAHLRNLQKQNKLPASLRFKTYCSAAPKPGNLYFAYDYEAMTGDGWSYTVVNSADWVPEVPVSIQTLDDFNNVNPFPGMKAGIKQEKFFRRLVLGSVYNSMDKPTKKANRKYQKNLGKRASKYVAKNIKGYRVPDFYNSNNYVRTGNFVILQATPEYYQAFPDDPARVFVHHVYEPYLYLAERLDKRWGWRSAEGVSKDQVMDK